MSDRREDRLQLMAQGSFGMEGLGVGGTEGLGCGGRESCV